ncbi:MAG: hypothetical protein ACYTJ0_01675 [Planctomycetota bacterium]|jgi:ribosomal protein L37AE/L43A
MSYQSIHKTLERWEFAVLGMLVVAFLIACVLMFVHATAALAMVWLGLVVLAVAFVVIKLLRRAERVAARHELASHHCPKCGAGVHHEPPESEDWHCDECDAVFAASGVELTAVETAA